MTLLFSGCLRNFNSNATPNDYSRFKVTSENFAPQTVFHWTYSVAALSNTQEYLDNEARYSAKNETLANSSAPFPSYAVVGYGLYLAPDPLASYSYGNIMISMKLKPAQNVPVVRIFGADDIRKIVVDAKVPLLVYRWEQATELYGKGAGVLRDPAVIEPRSFRVKDFRIVRALFDSKLNLTDLGVTAAALMEIATLPQKIRPQVATLVASQVPGCDRATTLEGAWRKCALKKGFNALRDGNLDANAAAVFQKTGYAPEKFYASHADLRKHVNERWLAQCAGQNARNFSSFLQSAIRYREQLRNHPWHVVTRVL